MCRVTESRGARLLCFGVTGRCAYRCTLARLFHPPRFLMARGSTPSMASRDAKVCRASSSLKSSILASATAAGKPSPPISGHGCPRHWETPVQTHLRSREPQEDRTRPRSWGRGGHPVLRARDGDDAGLEG